jgi:large conductance mechanosensitive channel
MFTGFKEFITKGNVIDVAVGFVAGAAFTALISGVTGAIITPLIGLISGGGVDAGVITVNGQVFDITAVINAIITFILTMALLYFVFVSPMNRWRERNQKEEELPTPVTDIELLTEIRDLLKRNAA